MPDSGMDSPLTSEADEVEEETTPETADEPLQDATETAPAKPARPPAPSFKPSTMILTFLFLLGILMIFDNNTRNQVAVLFGYGLVPIIGFAGHYVLLTMFLAAVLEMLLTAVAYNYTTDWVKAARVQKWSAAFRKVQMEALRSGKKDKMEALKVHQATLTKLTSEMSIAQLKGMAVTWFLVIAIYTWVGLFVACGHNALLPPWSCATTTNALGNVIVVGGNSVPLTHNEWIVPLWFLIFSLYTIPSSLILRRYLKHYSLRKYARTLAEPVLSAAPPARGHA
ncbi:MAG: EMC3/TMCO1 family protein [Thermoplasmata archaeon]|nr:EMC3/TMCO1 family protein [Thermoplasmata archaeon]